VSYRGATSRLEIDDDDDDDDEVTLAFDPSWNSSD
jgi:hypothetical protein